MLALFSVFVVICCNLDFYLEWINLFFVYFF